MGKQTIFLKDHADLAESKWLIHPMIRVENRGVVEPNASRVGRRQSGDQPQQGCLAGSGRPKYNADLATELERDIDHQPGMDPADHVNI